MAILQDDLQFYTAERLTDAVDAGGFATGTVVLDNLDNNLFPDISSSDRIAGRAQQRKCFAAARSPDNDVLMGGRVYIASPPADADVAVTLFAGTAGDELATAKAALEADTRPVYGIMTVAAEAAATATEVTVDNLYQPVCPATLTSFALSAALPTKDSIPVRTGMVTTDSTGAAINQVMMIHGEQSAVDLTTVVIAYVDANGTSHTITANENGALTGAASGSVQHYGTPSFLKIEALLSYATKPGAPCFVTCSKVNNVAWQAASFWLKLTAPVIPGSVTITANAADDDAAITDTDDSSGRFHVLHGSSQIDYATGFMRVYFLEEVKPATLAVSYSTGLPVAVDPELLGLDPIYFPYQGRRAAVRAGDFVIVQHLDSEALTNPVSAGATYTLARDQVQAIWLEDATGTRIPASKYTANLTAGSVTMSNPLDLSDYSQPLTAYTALQDEAMVIAIAANTLTLNRQLKNTYPADESTVAAMLRAGDLYARVSLQPFAQQAWTSVWSDALIGNEITPQYNSLVYPVLTTNDGAIKERWRIQFTGATMVHVIGEALGQIATSVSTTSDIAPINPATGEPYFTISKDGWGSGWVSGNLLRFNTEGAEMPIWLNRCVQPSDPPVAGTTDRIRLAFVGDVDA